VNVSDSKNDKTNRAGDKPGDKGSDRGAEAAPRSRKPVFLGGGVAALLALAFLAATMATPRKPATPRLEGPFVIKLSASEIQVNLAGDNSKRYLVMSLQAEYFAYGEHYVQARVGGAAGGHGGGGEDPHYAAMLKHALLSVSATKTREQVTDPVMVEAFFEEVREVVDPVLFPVLVGHGQTPEDPDLASGLRGGESMADARMRGLLQEHVLHVDAQRRTIRLDDGPVTEFRGGERDLRVVDARGDDVYVDVSGLEPAFRGEVRVGVAGKVRKIYRDSFLIQ
jgi:hypothetical protein